MSKQELQRLVACAVVSSQFCTEILNDRRAEFINDFALEPDESVRVLAIKADNLADFAAGVEQIMHLHRFIHRIQQESDLQDEQPSERERFLYNIAHRS